MGAPTIFTPTLAERICSLIAQGYSVRQIATMDDMPARSTIHVWLDQQPGFASDYQRAVEVRTEGYAEEIVGIADDMSIPPEHKRVMVDARKFVAIKLLPKKYGDKVDLNHTGTLNVAPAELTDEQITQRLAALRQE
jgi:hypothetical protein